MHNSLVSIIIPTYNVENYIEEGLNSILSQTYSNLEILIIDDCSTDNTVEIVKKKYSENLKIRLIEKSENSGPANSRNIGFKEAKGKYIALLDGDDYYEPGKIEKQVYIMEKNSNLTVCSTYLHTVGLYEKEIRFPIFHSEIKDQQLLGCPVAHAASMFRSSFLKENNLQYNQDLRFSEDYEFFIRILEKDGMFETIPEALYNYRITGNQASFVQEKEKIVKNQEQWEVSKKLHYKVLEKLLDKKSDLYNKKWIDALLAHKVIRNFDDVQMFIIWAKKIIKLNEEKGSPFSSSFLEKIYKKSVIGYFLAQKTLSWQILFQYLKVYSYSTKMPLTYQMKYIAKCLLFMKH